MEGKWYSELDRSPVEVKHTCTHLDSHLETFKLPSHTFASLVTGLQSSANVMQLNTTVHTHYLVLSHEV